MKKSDAVKLDINALIAANVGAAQKASKLSPVFLTRESFASKACPSGSLELDRILGGGIPAGRIIGISGPEHSGKSLLATDFARQQLEAGRVAAYMDAEGGSDPLFLKARGIDFDKYRGKRNKAGQLKPGEIDTMYFYQPENGDQLFKYMMTLMLALPENRNPESPPIVFVLDSVVALVSDAITENLDANRMAMHAKMYSEILPSIQAQLSRTGCIFVYTNQLRDKPGVSFGSPTYEPCGSALRFFAAIRLRLNGSKPKIGDKEHPFISGFIPTAAPKEGGVWQEIHDPIKKGGLLDRYNYTAIKTVKNKVYNPQKVAWMRIQFEEAGGTGHGLDKVYDTFSFLEALCEIERVNPTTYMWKRPCYDMLKSKKDMVVPDIGIDLKFDYYWFRSFVNSNKKLTEFLRAKYIESGKAYESSNDLVETIKEIELEESEEGDISELEVIGGGFDGVTNKS